MKKILFLLIFSSSLFMANGQTWSKINPAGFRNGEEKLISPDQFILAKIDNKEMKDLLWKARLDRSSSRSSSSNIKVMLGNGDLDEFQVEEYSMMEDELAEKFPEIRTFIGKSTTDPIRRIRIDHTTNGFRAVISDRDGKTYIDPYVRGDNEHRIIYRKKDLSSNQDWSCETISSVVKQTEGLSRFAGDCTLREYRLAVAAAGEYTDYHGGTVPLAQAQIVNTINRVNEIFEQDLSVRFILIGNNDLLIYTDGATDPYGASAGVAIDQNQTNIDNVIGSANYDIGHLFQQGASSGLAGLRVLCTNSKARGVTGLVNPIGDPFDIDFVAHEIGHQFGGNHTQNNSCQRSSQSVEPGSASTIMGYAGICAPNVQNNSDAYFHTNSILEMTDHITGVGNCGNNTVLANNKPVLSALNNYSVPKSTPLVLEAVANDNDNADVLTYCWEQTDAEVATMPPVSTNNEGPAFRSIYPSTDNKRYLPNINDLVANQTPTWEVLPSVTRTMNFTVTVRDHLESVGCTDEQSMTINVIGEAGPFLLDDNSFPSTVAEGQNYTLNWDVAGTDVAPISCANVDVFMSTDGGLTYPIAILSATDNDGTESIVIPAGLTTTARLMIKCSDNIFFDINDANFEVIAGDDGFTLEVDPISIESCNTDVVTFEIATFETGNFATDINLSVVGIPGGSNLSISNNPLTPGETATVTLSNFGSNFGLFTLDIVGVAGGETRTKNLDLRLIAPTTVPNLQFPSDNETGVSIVPELIWQQNTNAVEYDYELSTSPNGVGVIQSGTTTSTVIPVTVPLESLTTYYWRVSSTNECGTTAFSPEFSFTTIPFTCESFISDQTPLDITDAISQSEPSQTDLLIPVTGINGPIVDVNVLEISGTHTYVEDLVAAIFSPNGDGTPVVLFSRLCGNFDNFDLSFNDQVATTDIPCPPTTGLEYQPLDELSVWNGEDGNGFWQLAVVDAFPADVGTINSWVLEVCYEEAPCGLTVTSANGSGASSLSSAIACAQSGDVITLASSIPNNTIALGNNPLTINKNLTIQTEAGQNVNLDYTGIGTAITIGASNTVELKGVTVVQGTAPKVNKRILGYQYKKLLKKVE